MPCFIRTRSAAAMVGWACLTLVLTGCGSEPGDPAAEAPLRLVRTVTVAPVADPPWREFPGVVDAARRADLGFRIPGKLERLLAREGELVAAGQLLAELDDTDHRILVGARQAEHDQALADFERGRQLVEKGTIARSDFNKLEAQEATARANLAAARQNLAYTRLEAPFAGRIAKRYVEAYEDLAALQTVYTLQDISALTVRVDVPESVMIRVREGARPNVVAQFEALPGERFPLNLKEVSTQADPGSNTFQVTFSMPAVTEHTILPGMSVTVRGERAGSGSADGPRYYVPAHAVLEDANGRFVYVVEPAADDVRGTVSRRPVETGALSREGLRITAGLEAGQQVVTAGMSKMRDGLVVRLARDSGR